MTLVENIKMLFRRCVAATLFYTGMNTLYRMATQRQRAVILMYHRVIDSDGEQGGAYIEPGMYVTKDTFEKQMDYLSRVYHVVALDEVVDRIHHGQDFQANTCVLTFDDGWRDTHLHAFPMLRKYDLPAEVFVVSDYVGSDRIFWPERVSGLLMSYFDSSHVRRENHSQYSTLVKMRFFDIVEEGRSSPGQKIEMIIRALKELDQDKREKALAEMAEWLEADSLEESNRPGSKSRLLLDWDETMEMSQSRITFGSHTKTHALLTKIPRKQAAEEIVESRGMIEGRLRAPCRAFCYPNGDLNDEIREIVKQHYAAGLTTRPGLVQPGDDPWTLRRIAIHEDITFTKAMFACRISGILNLLGL